jgi:hypothetical protein
MHREALAGRENGKMNNSRWYGYVYPKNLVKFAGEKLIIQVTAKRPTVIYDVGGLYMTGGGSGPFYGIRLKNRDLSIKFLLSILNSRLFGWIIHQQSTNLRGGYIKFSKQYIEKAPMMLPKMGRMPNQKQFIQLVDSMLDLNSKIMEANSAAQKEIIQRQINSTDQEINRFVYELYGLTKEEIKIVEGVSK